MNKSLLQSIMVQAGDTQADLAEALGLSLSRFNAKLNNRDGADFTQSEIQGIMSRYDLSPETGMAIFFAPEVS